MTNRVDEKYEAVYHRMRMEADGAGFAGMGEDAYDPVGGHTREEADAAYEELFRELHGASGGGAQAKSKQTAHVVGSKNPDTDSICSAICYARLKNLTDSSAVCTAYAAGHINAETAFVLARFGVSIPELPEGERLEQVILMGHSEWDQAAAGVEKTNIAEIISHHKIGDIETSKPIYFRNEPVGATSTIVYRMYGERGETIDTVCAGLLCSGIIAGTQLFRSSATTRTDKLAAVALANIAGLDIEAYAREMWTKG
jgi:manganese-dependent inorganic pyrophosphatase